MSTQVYTNAVTLTDATEFDRFDSCAYCYLAGVAGTNTITATGPANMVLTAPQVPIILVPAITNSGATTLNITPSGGSALTAKAVFCNGIACAGGELKAGVPAILVYDGTQYQIVGPLMAGTIPGTLSVTGLTSLGSVNCGTLASTGNISAATGAISAGVAISASTYCDLHPGTTSQSSLRIEHGVAPTSPVNGDMWTTSAGLFIQINGVTKTVTLT